MPTRTDERHEATHETYTVRIGDTLSEIGERFAVSHQDLAAFNDIANPDRIYPGQVIKIPHA